MIDTTPHSHTKKALFSQDIPFQQSSIKGFRGRRFGTNREICGIMEKICHFRNILRKHYFEKLTKFHKV